MPDQKFEEEAAELKWFLDLAELQNMDETQTSHPPQFFWDTSDVSRCLLGMASYYTNAVFDKEEFDSRRTLARSLAAAGWFQGIRLLLPHQEEFLNLLERKFSLPIGGLPAGGSREFLADALGRDHLTLDVDSPSFDQDIVELVQQEASHAETLFKAVQGIGHWQSRQSDWRRSGLLELPADPTFDYAKVLGSPRLEKLRAFFKRQRPNYPVNNFTDSMALCYLQFLLEDALATGKALPLFFASSSLIRKAASSVGDDSFLTYEADAGQRISILRDEEYFIFRASLYPAMKVKSAAGITEIPMKIFDHLRNLIKDMGAQSREQNEAMLSQTRIEDRPIIDMVRSLRQLWFLDRVWLPYAAAHDLEDATKEYVAVARKLANSEAYRQQMAADLRSTTKTLESNIHAFTEIRRLWVHLQSGVENFRNSVAGHFDSGKMELQFGLIRFALAGESLSSIRDILNDLLSENQQTSSHRALQLMGSYRTDGREAIESEALAGVLWILGMDTELVDLCRREKRRPEGVGVWLDLIHAGALLRLRRTHDLAEVEEMIRVLNIQLISVKTPYDRAQIACGLGYLYFHWWRVLGGTAPWRSAGKEADMPTSGRLNVKKAIDCATQAIESSDNNRRLHAYSINQMVYYVTEAGDDQAFDQISSLAVELLEMEPDHTIWQYRFDDTLARYFHRMALLNEGTARSQMFDEALTHSARAVRTCGNDIEVKTYASQLLIAKTASVVKFGNALTPTKTSEPSS